MASRNYGARGSANPHTSGHSSSTEVSRSDVRLHSEMRTVVRLPPCPSSDASYHHRPLHSDRRLPRARRRSQLRRTPVRRNSAGQLMSGRSNQIEARDSKEWSGIPTGYWLLYEAPTTTPIILTAWSTGVRVLRHLGYPSSRLVPSYL